MKKPLLPFVLAAAFLAPVVSSAATIYVDFGPSSSFVGLLPGKGETTGLAETWNNFTDNTTAGGATLALVNSTGATTGYSLATNGTFTILNEAANPTPSPYSTLASGDAFYTANPRTLTLSGLNPSLTYSITIYGYANRTDSRLSNVTIGGITQSYQPAFTFGPDGTNNTADDNKGGGSTTFSNLVPSASGEIAIGLSSAISPVNNFILGTMEINYIPEPSHSLLTLSGAAFLLLRRRKA